MLAIVVMSIAATATAKQWKTVIQREKEADLLARGIEIQNAIAAYSAARKQGRVVPGEMYPLTLEELTRSPKPFLRKIYQDPITGGEWEYVRDPTGRIKGVRSKSTLISFKQHDFPLIVRHFEGTNHYSDWVFQYPNASMIQTPQPLPGTPQGTSATGTPPMPGGAPSMGLPAVPASR
jgi:type II secretory pathway pseudopilin PulG